MTDAAGTRSFGYDPATLVPVTETLAGLVDAVVTRTYETAGVPGRPEGFQVDAGHPVSWGYEPATGRLASVWWSVDATPDSASYTYLADSDLPDTRTLDGDVVTTYAYEPGRNLLTRVRHEVGATRVAQHDYTYNALGQRASATQSGRAYAEALNARLLGQAWFEAAQNTGSGVELLPDYRGYAYDPIGNRTGADAKDPDTGTLLPTAYTANALNQYTEVAPPLGPPQPLAHDEDGNLASFDAADATWLYTYDADNRLAAVEPQSPTTGDAKLALRYDYLGRRVQKVVSTYTGGLWVETSDTRFVYDGWNLVEERDAAGAVQKTYVWGLDLSHTLQGAGGIGGLLAVIEGPAVRYVLPDANGNVGQLIDAATNAVAAHYEYDPFGNVTYASGVAAEDNPFRFSTKYADGELESPLYYYGYRYYSLELGRWLTRDPIEEQGGINLYGFVGNSPVNDVDPFGLSSRSDIPHRLEYSCNCGWIDWGHARPGPEFRELWNGPNGILSNKGYTSIKTGFMVKYGQMMSFVSGNNKLLTHGVKGSYFVKNGLTRSQQESVALAIFQDITVAFETLQSGLPYSVASSSGFSEEDLTSNLLLFYRVVKGFDESKIRSLCGTVGKDDSLSVWDATGGLGKNKSWKPLDHNCLAGSCSGPPKWPAEFDTVKPASIQSGLWDYWGGGKIRITP